MNEDITKSVSNTRGARHIISLVIEELRSIFYAAGYTDVSSDVKDQDNYAPEIDIPFYNFTALGIGEDHPTRTDHQTFFLKDDKLLRSQTSNFQPRILCKYPNYFKAITIGRTYRNDNDATHTPMFHQIDMFACTPNSSVQELYNIIKWFLSEFFYGGSKEVEIRLRPSHFPFTTPSFEVDMFFNGDWLELIGCGITHKVVFDSLNLPFRTCVALGAGVERLAMIKYGIKDIREFYNTNIYNKHEHYALYKESN